MRKKHPESPKYLQQAGIARSLEQEGRYMQAAEYWQLAITLANRIGNMIWAENRAAFCRHYGIRLQARKT
ncbi:ANR family transcriptional regulator [Shewanella algae]|uniref:ANR family transcriptional regulator n=1 Tax=Shewanella algae TaxID=38313 RepID=UPI0031F54C03